MLIVSPTTVRNPRALTPGTLPRRVLRRIFILPRGAGVRDRARLVFEIQPLRYLGALAPFVVAAFVWPHLALPIAQAPLAMLVVIAFVEMRLLRIRREDRPKLVDPDEAARRLDLLNFRATRLLRRLAASRDMKSGELVLVVEQSELARIAPLTLVSVQSREVGFLPLGEDDRAALAELFDADLTERDLQTVNLAEDRFLRTATFDAAGVSAHARLAARLRATG